jgi:aspartate kinase
VSAGRVLDRKGFLQRVFDVLDRNRCAVELVCSSENTVSVAAAPGNAAHAIETQLAREGAVDHESAKAILCLVGEDLFGSPEVIATVFGALRGVEVRMVSQGASRSNFAVVVDESEVEGAIRRLHAALFGKRRPEPVRPVLQQEFEGTEIRTGAAVSGASGAQAQ